MKKKQKKNEDTTGFTDAVPVYSTEAQKIVGESLLKRGYKFIGMSTCRGQSPDKLYPHYTHTWQDSYTGKTRTSTKAIDKDGYDVYLSHLVL